MSVKLDITNFFDRHHISRDTRLSKVRQLKNLAPLCSVLLIAVMLAYYIVTAFQVWKWADKRVNASKVPWPDWAWAMGAGAAACWFIASGLASGTVL